MGKEEAHPNPAWLVASESQFYRTPLLLDRFFAGSLSVPPWVPPSVQLSVPLSVPPWVQLSVPLSVPLRVSVIPRESVLGLEQSDYRSLPLDTRLSVSRDLRLLQRETPLRVSSSYRVLLFSPLYDFIGRLRSICVAPGELLANSRREMTGSVRLFAQVGAAALELLPGRWPPPARKGQDSL